MASSPRRSGANESHLPQELPLFIISLLLVLLDVSHPPAGNCETNVFIESPRIPSLNPTAVSNTTDDCRVYSEFAIRHRLSESSSAGFDKGRTNLHVQFGSLSRLSNSITLSFLYFPLSSPIAPPSRPSLALFLSRRACRGHANKAECEKQRAILSPLASSSNGTERALSTKAAGDPGVTRI